MKRITASIWLVAFICLARVSVVSADGLRADHFFLNEQQLPEVAILGIARSDDPWALFEAFAKNVSVETSAGFQGGPRDIRSVVEAGRGDRFALGFVLLNLFRWNGIDTELVFLSTKRDSEHGDRYIEQALVYVPALKQYFDPALPFDKQHDSADRAWLSGRARMYFSAALQHKGKAVGRCRDICLAATNWRYRGGEFRVPNAVSVKTIRVPVTDEREGRSPKQ